MIVIQTVFFGENMFSVLLKVMLTLAKMSLNLGKNIFSSPFLLYMISVTTECDFFYVFGRLPLPSWTIGISVSFFVKSRYFAEYNIQFYLNHIFCFFILIYCVYC